jgi:hypothetical protein
MPAPGKERTQTHPSRATGLQAAQVAHSALLDAWRRQMSPREYATLLDLLGRRVDRERAGLPARLRRAA